MSADYVAAAMVACPRCGAATGSPCRVRKCRNGYANCSYAACSVLVELPEPHLERAVKARMTAAPTGPEHAKIPGSEASHNGYLGECWCQRTTDDAWPCREARTGPEPRTDAAVGR